MGLIRTPVCGAAYEVPRSAAGSQDSNTVSPSPLKQASIGLVRTTAEDTTKRLPRLNHQSASRVFRRAP